MVKRTLIDERPDSLQDCVAWARRLWEDNYSNQIRQLLFNFPSDQVSGLTHSTVHASVYSVQKNVVKQFRCCVLSHSSVCFLFRRVEKRSKL